MTTPVIPLSLASNAREETLLSARSEELIGYVESTPACSAAARPTFAPVFGSCPKSIDQVDHGLH